MITLRTSDGARTTNGSANYKRIAPGGAFSISFSIKALHSFLIHFAFNYEESCLAAAGRDVDHGRIGEANHSAVHAPAKQERVGVNKHWLHSPATFTEDGKL